MPDSNPGPLPPEVWCATKTIAQVEQTRRYEILYNRQFKLFIHLYTALQSRDALYNTFFLLNQFTFPLNNDESDNFTAFLAILLLCLLLRHEKR